MSKREVDKWFAQRYEWLEEIATAHIIIQEKNIEPSEAISHAYMHALRYKGELDSNETIERYMSNFLMRNISWSNSKLNKQTIATQSSEPDLPIQYEDDSNLDDKIAYEKWYNDCKSTLAMYRETIEERHLQIFFDVYFKFAQNGTKPSVRKIAKHFNISSTSSHNLIREMLDDLECFIQKQKQE